MQFSNMQFAMFEEIVWMKEELCAVYPFAVKAGFAPVPGVNLKPAVSNK